MLSWLNQFSYQFLGPEFALTLCMPIDDIVRNVACFSFYWELTRHTTFQVESCSTFLPPNDRIVTDRPFVNFLQLAKEIKKMEWGSYAWDGKPEAQGRCRRELMQKFQCTPGIEPGSFVSLGEHSTHHCHGLVIFFPVKLFTDQLIGMLSIGCWVSCPTSSVKLTSSDRIAISSWDSNLCRPRKLHSSC